MSTTPAIPNTPKGHIQRGKPSPFQRPSVNLGGDPTAPRRTWAAVPVRDIAEGDIVPGIGLITLVQELWVDGQDSDAPRPLWTIHLEGAGGSLTFQGTDVIWAFAAAGRAT